MGRIHPTRTRLFSSLLILTAGLLAAFVLSACNVAATNQGFVKVVINIDGKQIEEQAPAGATIQSVLDSAAIQLSNLDRVEPPTYTLLTGPTTVKVTRVEETFENKDLIIPFSQQQVKNESLPEGQTRLIQAGANGVEQVTYRHVFEDGVEISSTAVKDVVITEPRPEIIMVGVQTPFTAVPISNKLAYLTAGNAWIMQRSTGDRRPLVSSGDLDGRVFTLSQDGKWLLYTRKSTRPLSEEINTLWVVSTTDDNPTPINLKVSNIIHFATFMPGLQNNIIYSTVEPRSAAPGWQANNDLQRLVFTAFGTVINKEEILAPNSGGIYGWWGTQFSWSSDGKNLAYARPDSIGLVDLEKKKLDSLLDLLPFQARGDWAWVPGIAWSPDGKILYTVTHTKKTGLSSDESSPIFDLSAIVIENDLVIDLVPQAGMFAYPSASLSMDGEQSWVAYLQAIFPDRSETSRYRVVIQERDGSNRRTVFPPEGTTGIDPMQAVWSPGVISGTPLWLALIYQGNLWLVDPTNGQSQQITGDGLISRIDWK
jgi:hypothetical protein